MAWAAAARVASASMNSIAVMPPSAWATSRMPGSSSPASCEGMPATSRASAAPQTRPNTLLVSGRSASASSTYAPASVSNCAACSTAAMPSGSTGASKPGLLQHADGQAGDAVLDAVAPVAPIVGQAERVAQVAARHGREHQRGVAHRAGHRAGARQRREGARRPLRDTAVGGLQPDQPAPRRRNADRAAGIGADMQRPEPRRARRARAGRGAAGRVAGFHGLRVMPCSGQSPGDFQPNSVVVVLPRMTAPAAFSPATIGASSGTGSALVVRLPRRVGKPARSTRSFTVHGTPSRMPIGRPDSPAGSRFQPLPRALSGSSPRTRSGRD